MRIDDMGAARKLQPLDLRQLEERLEVSALSGGLMGGGLIEEDCITCCYPNKCARIFPLLLPKYELDGPTS